MIIAISGLTGSGKNTLGSLLADKLGCKLVCPTFKDLARKEGIPLMEFQKRAEKDPDIDKKFDELLKEQATGDCVVTTWLGPWMVDADLKIKLSAPAETRARRIAERDSMELEGALKHVKERDRRNRERYLKLYGIDIYDESIYDAVLDSGRHSPEELLEMVLGLIKRRE
ncbi:AAA family ATPase [Candidatus Micrarchaeota archaeon]|nr:AAA family ATPase [Candidatus Micrarchaeota archaeon]